MVPQRPYFLFGLFAFRLVLCSCVHSQSFHRDTIGLSESAASSRTELRIRVLDRKNLGARVLVDLDSQGSPAFSAYTDWSGNVAFQGLPAGKYTVVIVLNGQQVYRKTLTLPESPYVQNEVLRLSAFKFTYKTDKTSVNDLGTPEKAYKLYLEGLEAIRSGNLEQALEDLDAALNRSPAHSKSHNARGVVLHMSQRNNEAEEEFRAALRFDPESFEPLFNLGKLLLECNRPKEARAELQRAFELDSESIATVELLVDSMLMTHDTKSAVSLTESLHRRGLKYPARIDLQIAAELRKAGMVELAAKQYSLALAGC